MGKKENYESRVERYLLPLMEEHHFELVDVEYVKEAGTWYPRGLAVPLKRKRILSEAWARTWMCVCTARLISRRNLQGP